jgi:glycosyltransferase involved in cell wall biosynthesis
MVNVLLITSSYPGSPGEGTFLSSLAESISGEKNHVFVLCPHKDNLPFSEEQKGITIIRFPYWLTSAGQALDAQGGLITSVQRSHLALFQLIPFCISQFLRALQTIQNKNIDLVHTHWIIPQGVTGAFLRLCTGIPHISSVHGTDIHLVHAYPVLHPLLRFIMRYSDCITTNSSHTFRLVKDIIPSKEQNMHIIPMGIPVGEFPESFRKREEHADKVILFVGRLIAWKGTHVLIEALSYVQQTDLRFQLIIIGEGPQRESLTRLTENNRLSSVEFIGTVSRNRLLSYYQKADLLVLPSISVGGQTEGLGVVLLEAMASGVPVIGSDTGGIPDIIEDEVTGLLVQPDNPELLSHAIIRLLTDNSLADRLAHAAFQKVRNRFSWDCIGQKFQDLYSDLSDETP